MHATFFRSALCLMLLPVAAAAQDPFGETRTADPFAKPARGTKPAPKAEIRASKAPGKTVTGVQATLAAEDHIRDILGNKTTLSVVEQPLMDVVDLLSQQHDIPMVIDVRSLEEVGLSVEEPISLTLKNVTLRSYLRLALRSLELTYVIKDEVLKITTQEAAERDLVLQIYRLPDALAGNSDQLMPALTANVSPDQWEDKGGPGTVSVINDMLVVSATENVHEGINEFLEKVRIASERRQ